MTHQKQNETITAHKTCLRCGKPFTRTMTHHEGLGWPMRPSEFKRPHGTCDACKMIEREEWQIKRANETLGWTFETVKKYFTEHPPAVGDPLIVVNQQFHQNEYQRVFVENPAHTRQKRIIVDKPGTVGGLAFYRSGQSCFAPKGNTRLLPDHPVMSELFHRYGDRFTLDDKALAAVMTNADIKTFKDEAPFPITVRD